MNAKLLLTWNIRPGHEREHGQQIRRFVAKIATLGLDLTDAWYTIYGDAPHILLGIVAHGGEKERLERVLASEEWKEAFEELDTCIVDYRQRVVRAIGNFQI